MKVCWYVSSCVFKSVYGNLEPFLAGIRRIPAYYVDYTTGKLSSDPCISSYFFYEMSFMIGVICQFNHIWPDI